MIVSTGRKLVGVAYLAHAEDSEEKARSPITVQVLFRRPARLSATDMMAPRLPEHIVAVVIKRHLQQEACLALPRYFIGDGVDTQSCTNASIKLCLRGQPLQSMLITTFAWVVSGWC